ncbi:hypothetical protein [Streptomyces sp. NPDC058683]|uniref:hypothetical protein n=1 Tax=Streptomyces sp. NPDC058683 TaxID=3346597 RepID=UPI00364E95B4
MAEMRGRVDVAPMITNSWCGLARAAALVSMVGAGKRWALTPPERAASCMPCQDTWLSRASVAPAGETTGQAR